jgi:hypothetical protein
MTLTILVLYLATGPEPAWAYVDPAACHEAARALRDHHGIVADCRTAQITTPVGPAPIISPRPMANPEGLK